MSAPQSPLEITPSLLLRAYANGVFPMAESEHSDEVFWVDPKTRGILPLDGLRVSRSMAKFIRRSALTVTINSCFEQVVSACAARPETWINEEIFDLYGTLHRLGFAHSVEIWDGETLYGGLYGVAIGGAFFGESMFSHGTNGSKTALIALVTRLRHGGYSLLDTQFITPHLASLGAIEISRADYHKRLDDALEQNGGFFDLDAALSLDQILHLSNQTS